MPLDVRVRKHSRLLRRRDSDHDLDRLTRDIQSAHDSREQRLSPYLEDVEKEARAETEVQKAADAKRLKEEAQKQRLQIQQQQAQVRQAKATAKSYEGREQRESERADVEKQRAEADLNQKQEDLAAKKRKLRVFPGGSVEERQTRAQVKRLETDERQAKQNLKNARQQQKTQKEQARAASAQAEQSEKQAGLLNEQLKREKVATRNTELKGKLEEREAKENLRQQRIRLKEKRRAERKKRRKSGGSLFGRRRKKRWSY